MATEHSASTVGRSFLACTVVGAPHIGDLLYDGPFDPPQWSTPEPIPVRLELAEGVLQFDLRQLIERSDRVHARLATLSVLELLNFCREAKCSSEAENGHLYLSSQLALRHNVGACYAGIFALANDVCYVVVAFNETQPARYKAALIAAVKQIGPAFPAS